MSIVSFLLFIILAAILIAILEIQIEGPAGWAKNLPTWRPNPNKWYAKFFGAIRDQKELTGYHIALWFTVLLFFHFPLFVGTTWNASFETDLLAGFFFFWILEDFLWFVFNPAFGIKKFKPEFIPWHKKWIGPFPKSYYTGFIMVIILYIIYL